MVDLHVIVEIEYFFLGNTIGVSNMNNYEFSLLSMSLAKLVHLK